MSLFGGDPPASQRSDSTFSISPIQSVSSNNAAGDTNFDRADALEKDHDYVNSPQSLSEPDLLPGTSPVNVSDDDQQPARQRSQASDSLWRYYTREETKLARSHADQRADDLSAHLYNAHSWKRSTRADACDLDPSSLVARDQWLKRDSSGKRLWHPPTKWSAWPLEPEQVPPPKQRFWGPDVTEYDAGDELREELSAAALRQIKAQWQRRPSERRPATSRSTSREASAAFISGEDEQYRSPSGHAESEVEDRPVLSADVQHINYLLGPMVISLQGRLDRLLLALHHNRAGHYAVGREPEAERLRRSSHSRSRSRSVSRARQRSADSGSGDSSSAERPSRPRKRQKRSLDDERGTSAGSMSTDDSENSDFHRPQPRDWSEVLGVAALTGWDQDALRRAKDRCEALLGEQMSLETLFEQPDSDEESISSLSAEEEPVGLETIVTRDGLLCPFIDCKRQAVPFPATQAYRFREHLQRAHKLVKEEVERIGQAAGINRGRATVADSNPRGWTAPDPLSCPHDDCPSVDNIYPEPRRLLGHLMRFHKYDPRTQSPPAAVSTGAENEISDADTGSEVLGQAEDFMVGGVHNDGFLAPIGKKVANRKVVNKVED